jgi:NADPH2:quinone reductase
MEAAGVVEEIGRDVQEVAVGDRVAYVGGPLGAYADARVISAAHLVKLPPSITDAHAAAMLLQGMTAQFLVRRTYNVQRGDNILVHAAAGGVGSILCQWAKALGATVIGTVGSSEKADIAVKNGCDHVINYRHEDFVKRVAEITNGSKVGVVYDSVGKDTFIKSFDCLRPFGTLVLFGQSSGIVGPLETRILTEKGSLFLTRPALWAHIGTRAGLISSAQELFDMVQTGAIKILINQTYPLRDAARAHGDVEARRTTGSTVFTV